MIETVKPTRQERRAKQREANLGRAQKMHEARMGVSPLVPAQTLPDHVGAQAIHIGCSGWYYWDWKGTFYPETMPTSQWFDHYKSQFNTVELNAPFYSWPTLAIVRTWLRQTHEQPFVYTIKVCELITHIKRFQGTQTLIKDFGFIADMLGPYMGCFLFQLPPGFHYTAARLKAIVKQLDPARRNVVEFRHVSWWNDDVYGAFEKAGIIFCACSAPKLPNRLIKTADDIYIRFHGTAKWYRHDYSAAELDEWAARIKECGAKRIWIYFNNDYDGYAIKNAHELQRRLKKKNVPFTTA